MRIKKIALSGFRNYEWETAEFNEGTNVISGENAQGKTNLLEAVYMLSCGRSFRTRFDRELIGFGYSGAEILADVVSHDREQTIKIQLRQGLGKRITVNSVKKTAAELSSVINTVLFCPDDLNLILTTPFPRYAQGMQNIFRTSTSSMKIKPEYSRTGVKSRGFSILWMNFPTECAEPPLR